MKRFQLLRELRKVSGITLRDISRSVKKLKAAGEIEESDTIADIAEMVLIDLKPSKPLLADKGLDFDWETIIELIIQILMAIFGL